MSRPSSQQAPNVKDLPFLAELEARQAGPTVAELRYYLRRDRCNLHLFFEGGADKLFYVSKLKEMCPAVDDFEVYECGGREAVIDLLGKFGPDNRMGYSALFFIDRDLGVDPSIEACRYIFVTDGYSFENYFVDASVFIEYAKQYIGLTSVQAREPFVKLFENFIYSANRNGVRISRFVCALRSKGTKVEFEEFSATKLVKMDESFALSLSKFAGECASHLALGAGGKEGLRSPLNKAHKKTSPNMVRGKYILAWFGLFLRKLNSEIRGGKFEIPHAVVPLSDYGVVGMVSVLKSLVPIPQRLFRFFDMHLSMLNIPDRD